MSGIEKLQTSLKSLDLGQGRLITRENLPSLFAKFPGRSHLNSVFCIHSLISLPRAGLTRFG